MVATNSSRLPSPTCQRASDISPPAAAMTATATAAISENRASAGCPTANEHCSIAQQAAANAMTAEVVCTKSGQVNDGPYGIGHPAVQVTCDASRKNPPDTQRLTLGRHQRSTATRERMSRAATPMSADPATIATSAAMNQCSVGMPSAPSSET